MGATGVGRLEAVDLGLGKLRRSRIQNIVTKGHAGRRAVAQLWLPAALCVSVIAYQQFHPLAFTAPVLRAIAETGITMCMLLAAGLFALTFGHRRHLRNLLLAGALLELAVIDFVSYVMPAAVDLRSPGFLIVAPMLGKMFMAVTIAVGASIDQNRQVGSGHKPLLVTVAVGLLVAGAAELGGIALRPMLASDDVTYHGFAAAIEHPVGVALSVAAAAFLALAAVRMATFDRDGRRPANLLLAVAMVAIAGASLNYLVLPTPGVGWVTAREGLRIAAYALILAVALRQEAASRRTIADAAAAEERRRIARDLHDGLAQDLAFIAAHGDRIAREEGEDHPLAIAARRALAVSRGAIADLSAADAPSANAALRRVADELEQRFGVGIAVDAEQAQLSRNAREDVVRIAREAIVNAVKAGARRVTVSLVRDDDRFIMRVLDDGPGFTSGESAPGFGLRYMHERAASLGGGLNARSPAGGGNELEVVFP